MIHRAVLLAAAFAALAGPVCAQQEILPFGPETEAAVGKLRAGDMAGGRAALQALADKDQPDAQFVLGGLLFDGADGRPADKSQACVLWEKAARTRADAAHLTAECAESAYGGGAKDPVRARVLFRRAADMGFAKSKCALGNMLMRGEGGPLDVAGGMALCREAAEAGDPDAQTDLADVYIMGRLVPKDAVKARGWYEKAAAQKQANAAFVLAQIYWNGDGTAKDPARATALWQTAYDGGRIDAAFFLGNAAMQRMLKGPGGNAVDRIALDEAIGWFEDTTARDPDPEHKAKAREALDILDGLKKALPKAN